jgi:hypothetical protein
VVCDYRAGERASGDQGPSVRDTTAGRSTYPTCQPCTGLDAHAG